MALKPDEVVVVLGPPGSRVFDVATVENVLNHLTAHITEKATERAVAIHGYDHVARPPVQGPERPLRFFTTDGAALELGVLADWSTFTLEPNGSRTSVEQLEAEVHATIEAHRDEIDALGYVLPKLPPPGTWPEQVQALLRILNPGPAEDVRGPWHNFFVHGW
jgi:hypothetical protein